jgi:serine/threonine-protein kinase
VLAPAAPAPTERGPGEARATTPAAADANATTMPTVPEATARPPAAMPAAPASIDGAAAAVEGSAAAAIPTPSAPAPPGATSVTAIGSSADPASPAGSTQGAAAAPAAPATASALPTVPAALPAPAIKPGNAAATALTTAAAPGRESIKDRRTRESRERDTRERDARAAASLVAPATGTVRIAISPWGLVEVDGASSGAAPPITELTLAEGRHQIVIRNGDNTPFTTSVNVIAGQTISVRHKFGS